MNNIFFNFMINNVIGVNFKSDCVFIIYIRNWDINIFFGKIWC